MPHEIIPNLWQGGFPVPGATRDFDAVVFCAKELLPGKNIPIPARAYAPSDVLLAPNDDARRPPTRGELALAGAAGKAVANRVEAGERVLVTCAQGRNRSGLVTAIAIRNLLGLPGAHCAKVVQRRRPDALTNPHFVRALSALGRPAAFTDGRVGFPTTYAWWIAVGRRSGLPYPKANHDRPPGAAPTTRGERGWQYDGSRLPPRPAPQGFEWVFRTRTCTEPGGGIVPIPTWGLAPAGLQA